MPSPAKKLKKSKSPKRNQKVTYRKAKDLPVTYRALDSTRKELKSDITSLRVEMRAGFARIDARFADMNNRMDERFAEMNKKMEDMNANNNRVLTLLEEQYSQNKASYEGAEFVKVQHESLSSRIDNLEKFQTELTDKLKTV